MNDHIHSFHRIVVVLLDLDENRALLLLNSLPSDYEHLTTTLLYDKNKVTFDFVYYLLSFKY